MAKIYISSTYQDLKEFREPVYRGLRQLEHDVRAMEDYVATDQRPLDECLADVAACDIYVGIIGLRYGFLPDDQGPVPLRPDGKKRSITELEFRYAAALKKPCLIFLANADKWPLGKTDLMTRENESGARIEEFRKELEALKVRAVFETPGELSLAVNNAVTRQTRLPTPPGSSPPPPPTQVREVRYATLLTYSAVHDKAIAFAEIAAIKTAGVILDTADLLDSESAADFDRFDRALVQCHTFTAFFSRPAFPQLSARAEQVARLLATAQARCGYCVALLKGVSPDELPPSWKFSDLFIVGGDAVPRTANGRSFADEIGVRCPQRGVRAVGLPLTIIAMTQAECQALLTDSEIITRQLGTEARDSFHALRDEYPDPLDLRYGSERQDWRPFPSTRESIYDLLSRVVGNLNSASVHQRGERQIKLQHYPFDDVDTLELRETYHNIAAGGAVCIVDELSLFHPDLRRRFLTSEFSRASRVALVTIAPFDSEGLPPHPTLENSLRSQLTSAFARFAQDLDPQCEFAIGGERRLNRWLWRSLPTTLRNLRQPGPNRTRLNLFAAQVANDAGGGMVDAIWQERQAP